MQQPARCVAGTGVCPRHREDLHGNDQRDRRRASRGQRMPAWTDRMPISGLDPDCRLTIYHPTDVEDPHSAFFCKPLLKMVDNEPGIGKEIGRAHVCTPVTNAPLVCRLLIEKTN